MEIPNSSKKTHWIIAAAVIILLLIGGGVFWMLYGRQTGPMAYIISGVPYFGIYNHIGTPNNTLGHDKDSVFASVLEYWEPGQNDFSVLAKNLNGRDEQFSQMVAFLNSLGHIKAEVKVLQLDQLRQYISPQTMTPLVAFFAIDENQSPDNRYYPGRVLIGIDENKKKLIFHDYWHGNNLEISFDEYNRLLEKTLPNFRNKYFVVQPVDLKSKLAEIKKRPITAYPVRTATMQSASNIFNEYALSVFPFYTRQYDNAAENFSRVINNPGFDTLFPPEYKVRAFTELAEMQLGRNDLENALQNIQTAVSLNHDLDKPFKDWPGFDFSTTVRGHMGEYSATYRVQGDIYRKMNDLVKAKQSYQMAIQINPNNLKAKAWLANIENTPAANDN